MKKVAKGFLSLSIVFVLLLTLTSCKLFGGGKEKFGNLRFELPEGFEMTEQSGVKVAISENYPLVTDNITFVKSGKDSIDNYSKEIFNNYYKNTVAGFKGIDSFERIEIDGVPSIRLEFRMTMSGVNMSQTQIMIFYRKASYVVTFTVLNSQYHDIFDEVIKSIKVKWSLF